LGLIIASFVFLAQTARAKDSPILLTVNGTSILRSEALQRAWKQYGSAVVNEMVDEVLTHQAAAKLDVKADAAEVDARLTRIQGQFKDETTFKERLKATGTSLPELRARIEEQVLRETLVRKAKAIAVTDDETKQFFDANKDKLSSDSVHLRHIQVASEKEANDFMVAAQAGADFGKLASQISLDQATKDKSGDLGFISRGMLQPDLEKIVFALKQGEIGGPVKTPGGYELFKAEEVRPAKAVAFDDVKKGLALSILADKTTKAWPGYLQELRDAAKIVQTAAAAKPASPTR
jgi:parvulin-like peptidyl-prolyl isomerase